MLTKKRVLSQSLALACAFTIAAGIFTGCGANKAIDNATSEKAETEATVADTASKAPAPEETPVNISVMLPLYVPEAPAKDSSALLKLQEHCNAFFDVTWVPSNTYNDKVNVSIASNQLPQATVVTDLKAPVFVNSARSGMFWEVGLLLENYPNLKNYNPVLLTNTAIDGKNFGLPRARVLTRTGLVYRKDWLNNVGLQPPTNLDELYNVIKAFTLNDPDMNSKNDTFGYSTVAAAKSDFNIDFGVVLALSGGGNEWDVQDGKLVPVHMTKPYMAALNWFKRLYSEELMNKDFASAKGENKFAFIDKEQGGIYIGNSDECTTRHTDLLKLKQKDNPDLKREDIFDFQSFLKSGDGNIKIPGGYGFFGEFVFSKNSVKSESDLRRILKAMDKLDDPEVLNVIKWGVENENYSVKDGKAESITESAVFNNKIAPFSQFGLNYFALLSKTLQGTMEPLTEKYYKEQAENAKNAVMDPTIPYISATQSAQGTELDKIIHDAKVKYIMGLIDENGFNQAVEQWKKSGGDKVIEEYNAENAKVHKK